MTRELAITETSSKSSKFSKASLRGLLRFGLISLGGVFVLGYGRSTLAEVDAFSSCTSPPVHT